MHRFLIESRKAGKAHFRPVPNVVRLRRMAKKKKLTAAERLVDEQMLALLEWATEYPKRDAWHKIGNLDATKNAADLLEKRGLIEIWRETGLYRLKPKK
jgi:hypothetical protein